MYGKVFDMMYDGTLHGNWEAIVTMQQLIVLASPDGFVDMTPSAISARTSIPLEIIEKGLKVLADPDPYTRTPGEEGRRIVLMDDHRPWGWKLVNHWKYKKLRNMDEKREADRTRVAGKRKKINGVAIVSQMSENVANVAHSDSDSDSDTKNKSRSPKGSRLQLEVLPKEWKAYCVAQRKDLDPERVFVTFRNYWIAKPGKDGRKLDWPATWQNWVLAERASGNGKDHAAPWWSSDSAIQAKARELGMSAKAGESWQQLRGRIDERLHGGAR